MQKIALGSGKFATVDDCDSVAVCLAGSWYLYGKYAACTIKGKNVRLHHFIAKRMGLVFDDQIDHEHSQPLNCCRDNLRAATSQQNNRNRTLRNDSESGYKGVSKRHSQWRARIKVNGKTYHLGYFKTPEDAARAYDTAAEKYFGSFAKLNFSA